MMAVSHPLGNGALVHMNTVANMAECPGQNLYVYVYLYFPVTHRLI